MALKSYNPTTPSQRQLVIVDRSGLHRGKPVKSLTQGLHSKGGRNNAGRVTAQSIGGGHKRTYRMVDFKRRKFDVEATVERMEYDPNRTAFIALITYADGEKSYILAPQRLTAGDKVISSDKAVDVKPGNCMPLQFMPVGTIVHNIEMKPAKGGQIARSAGGYAQLVGRDQGMAILRLNSGEQRLVQGACLQPLARCRTPTTSTSTTARQAAPAGRASALMSAVLR
jgi:large subunit ribosomal protein L2